MHYARCLITLASDERKPQLRVTQQRENVMNIPLFSDRKWKLITASLGARNKLLIWHQHVDANNEALVREVA